MRQVWTLLLLTTFAGTVAAEDWPQWFGPLRDGVWRESGLLTAFPEAGPPVLWRTPIHAGYSGPAVAGGRVYLTDRIITPDAPRPPNPFKRITQPGTERIVCLDEHSGKILWTYDYDCDYTMSYSAGPRATPVVDAGRIYALGAEGNLTCLDTTSGKKIWARALSSENSPTPLWGFAGNPLIDGDRLICLTSGKNPADGLGVVTAFDKRDGRILWTSLSAKEPGYASPIIVQAGGTRQLIVWDSDSVNSLDPVTGKVYWTIPFGPARMGLSVLTPRFYHDPSAGDLLMVATQYEGSLVIKLDPAKPAASIYWKRGGRTDKKTDALHSIISSPVLRDGHIYGVCIMGELRCLDLDTGDRLWASTAATTYDAGPQKWATAFLIPLGETGDRFLIPNEHGDLILAHLDPDGYHEVSRAHVLEPTNTDPQRPVVWSFPALADRCVFWRNDKEILCISFAAPTK